MNLPFKARGMDVIFLRKVLELFLVDKDPVGVCRINNWDKWKFDIIQNILELGRFYFCHEQGFGRGYISRPRNLQNLIKLRVGRVRVYKPCHDLELFEFRSVERGAWSVSRFYCIVLRYMLRAPRFTSRDRLP